MSTASIDLRDRIRDVPDFPTEGVVFKDLMAHAGLPQVAYAGVDDARWRADRAGVEREVAALGFQCTYVDGNAIAPATTRDVGAIVATSGATFVDGGIIAKGRLALSLSGDADGVERVAALFTGSDVDAIGLPGGVGSRRCLARALFHGGGHLIDSRCSLIHFLVLTLRATQGILGHGGQLF